MATLMKGAGVWRIVSWNSTELLQCPTGIWYSWKITKRTGRTTNTSKGYQVVSRITVVYIFSMHQ